MPRASSHTPLSPLLDRDDVRLVRDREDRRLRGHHRLHLVYDRSAGRGRSCRAPSAEAVVGRVVPVALALAPSSRSSSARTGFGCSERKFADDQRPGTTSRRVELREPRARRRSGSMLRLRPIFCRSCCRIWPIVSPLGRRPSVRNVNVVPGLTPACVEELLRLVQVERVRLELLVVGRASRVDQRRSPRRGRPARRTPPSPSSRGRSRTRAPAGRPTLLNGGEVVSTSQACDARDRRRLDDRRVLVAR